MFIDHHQMPKKGFIIIPLLFLGKFIFSQEASVQDSMKRVLVDSTKPKPKQNLAKDLGLDSTIDYDLLFRDMNSFLDSITSPGSYLMGNLAIGKGFYNYTGKSDYSIETEQKLSYTPELGYFHKGGGSFSATGNIVNNNGKLNFYQLSITPGYDYIKNKKLVTGINFTRYFTKDSLPFYTTPLQNELYTYFTYRNWWLKPTVAISYGWGSRSDYMEREAAILDLRLRRAGLIRINSKESVSDFSVITSLRHDFYWLNIFSNKDHFRLTPQISFISGTQKFGFNQSANTYVTVVRTGANVLYNSENIYLDDHLEFQPLSLTMFLKGEYTFSKFFIQPQLVIDYYFPGTTNKFNTLFSFNLGFIF